MALIDCPECEQRVSDRAEACPHCGFPVRKELALKRRGSQAEDEVLAEVSPAVFGRSPLLHIFVAPLCLVLVGLLIYLIEWLRCRATRLIVTRSRTILHSGLLARTTNEVRHEDIRNIQVIQGAIDRIFGLGTLELSSAGQGDIEIHVAGLPGPEKLADLIREHR